MSHYDDTAPASDRKGLLKAWLIGVTLAVAGGVSLVHLVGEYRAATPWREARAAEYAREREARDKAEAEAAAPKPPPAPVQGPVEWVVEPVWPRLTTESLPEGVNQVAVRFDCKLDQQGVLSDCKGTETPAGTGLSDRLSPALVPARMKPMQVDGRPVRSTVNFTVAFSTGRDEAATPPPPVPVPPPPAPAPSPTPAP
ncbi:MAG: hypothetical protein REJ23_10805 [Brevundimonas sp.]|nr:hypothetical protein [Brevundimonas sp.]